MMKIGKRVRLDPMLPHPHRLERAVRPQENETGHDVEFPRYREGIANDGFAGQNGPNSARPAHEGEELELVAIMFCAGSTFLVPFPFSRLP
jgi:hypothetical protein